MSELKEYQFDKITKFIDYRGKTPVKTEEGIPLITAKNIKFGYLSEEPKEFISEDDYDNWMSRGIPNKGDILFTTEAPLGNVCILDTNEKRAFAQRTIVFQPLSDDIYISNYLFYYLMSPIFIDELDSKKTGTTVYGIKSSILKKFKIPLPSLEEQKRIVAKLDILFAKIDKAIALHQKNIDEANVFMTSVLNDVFVELEEKYEKKQLKDIVNNFDGKRIPIKSSDRENINGIYPYYGASGVIDYVNDYIFDGEYLLISEDGANLTVRKYPIAFIAMGKFWVNNHAHIVSAKENISTNKFMEYAFAFTDISDYITGSAQPKMSQGKMNLIEFVIPPLKTQQKVVSYLDDISQKMEKMKQIQKEKMQSLKALKASILDQAFRGEL